MFKPNLHLRLSDPGGVLAVDQYLIELFSNTAKVTVQDSTSFDWMLTQFSERIRESFKIIDSCTRSYLNWFALCRLPRDVKQE